MKILAAIVTHNRCELLSRCIDHVEQQEHAPDHLIVINNASTDDTADMLAKRGVECVTQANLGSAGGWNRAIGYCLDHHYDAIWLMDDDGFADSAALRLLAAALTDGIACVSSMVIREDDSARFVFPFPVLNHSGLPTLFGRPRKIATVQALRQHAGRDFYPFAHLFNGALIAASAIERIGNVDTRFFMFGDEVDYYFRLGTVGVVASHLGAIHYHPDVTARGLTDIKVYYFVKNTIILNHRYFDRPALRSLLTIAIVLWRVASRNGIANAASLLAGRRSLVLRRAILRGLAGNVGHDFDATG